MRRTFTLFSWFLLGLLVSCSDRVFQERLEAADSVMWSAPDSAYRIVQAIDPDSLSTEAQQAYYGLLYTQAQYKNYVPIASDSLILRSVFYYEGRDDYKFGLSLYYLGTVYQDKEFYNLAIGQYKHALEYIDVQKYPHIVAQLHRSMGSVYYKQYFAREAIEHYQQAERLYQLLADSARLCFLYGEMGSAYRMVEDQGSAMRYYDWALGLARKLNDSKQISLVQNRMAWLCKAQGKAGEARPLIEHSIATNSDQTSVSNQGQLMGHIAFAEGKMDSALYYLDHKSSPNLIEDKLRSQIYYAQGRYCEAYDIFQGYFQQVSQAWKQRDQVRADEIMAQYDYQHITKENEILARNLEVWVVVGSLLLLLLVALVFLYITRRRQHQMEARHLNEALRGLRQTISEEHLKLRVLLEKRVGQFATLAEWSSIHHENDTALAKKVRAMIEKNPLRGQEAEEILHTVNHTSNGLVDYLHQTYPELNPSELLICALTYMGYDSHQLYAILSARNVKTIYDKRHKIVRKMQERGDLKHILDRIAVHLADQ